MPSKSTPGAILKKKFMDTHQLSMNKLAAMIDVPPNRISAIVNGTRAITADTALRLSKCFENEAEYWMDLQRDHDLTQVAKVNKRLKITTVSQL